MSTPDPTGLDTEAVLNAFGGVRKGSYGETVCQVSWVVAGIDVHGNMPWLQTGTGVGRDDQPAEGHDPRQLQARNAISHDFGSMEPLRD
jgi:hypothetical protein